MDWFDVLVVMNISFVIFVVYIDNKIFGIDSNLGVFFIFIKYDICEYKFWKMILYIKFIRILYKIYFMSLFFFLCI